MKKLDKVLNYIEEYSASSLLIFTSLLVFVQAFLRYAFNYSLHWSEETARHLIVWFIFIGSSIAVREKAHVTIDVIIGRLPNKMRKVVEIIASIISIVFTILIILAGIAMVNNAIKFNARSSVTGSSLIYAYLAIPVGAGLMLIRFIQELAGKVKEFGKSTPEEGGDIK